jgi:hypothetical protein
VPAPDQPWRAGMRQVKKATPSSSNAILPNVSGSVGFTNK